MADPMGLHMGVWGKYDVVRFRGPYMEVDLEDMRSPSRILDAIVLGGARR